MGWLLKILLIQEKKYFGCSIAICLIVDKKGGGGGGSNSSAPQQQFNFKYQTLLTNCIEWLTLRNTVL